MKRAIFLLFYLLWGCENSWADTAAVSDKGKQLYLSRMAVRYAMAAMGMGRGINAQKFDPPPTDFHNPQAYLHGLDRDSIRRSIQNGIKEDKSIMPAFQDIPPDEMDQIISFLESLQRNK